MSVSVCLFNKTETCTNEDIVIIQQPKTVQIQNGLKFQVKEFVCYFVLLYVNSELLDCWYNKRSINQNFLKPKVDKSNDIPLEAFKPTSSHMKIFKLMQ